MPIKKLNASTLKALVPILVSLRALTKHDGRKILRRLGKTNA